jgi:hypothetical protein
VSIGGYYYLATPYTKYAEGQEKAFIHAAEQTAILLRAGLVVFSPIVHCHPLHVYAAMDGQTDFEAWRHVDETMMRKAAGLIVCKLPGWDASYGIKAEIEWFQNQLRARHIYMMEPGIVPTELCKQ